MTKYLTFILIFGLLSCEKNHNDINYESYSDYLSDKGVISIGLFNNNVWTLSYKHCDSCHRIPELNYPSPSFQLTKIYNGGFKYEEPSSVSGPKMDQHGNLYTATQNKLFKLVDIKNYQLILDTKEFNFLNYAFDKKDNIWFSGFNGIGFWNHQELKVFNRNNSILSSNSTHGLTIDNDGNVWVGIDGSILKISGDQWNIIPYSEIPGLKTSSYLSNPMVDRDNNIWFKAFNSNTGSNIIKFNGITWNYEYPNLIAYGNINIDSKGIPWIISENISKNAIAYFKNNEWIDFDVSRIEPTIKTVNADDKNVYIGTFKGLEIIAK